MEKNNSVEKDNVFINVDMMFSDDPTITIRHLFLGATPTLLIEPYADDETNKYGFNIQSVDLDEENLVSVLRLCANAIESMTKKSDNNLEDGVPDGS